MAPLHSSVKNEYPVIPLGEETVQAVVGSIVWTFRRLKKPRRREMSARGYALHNVCPKLSFPSFHLFVSNFFLQIISDVLLYEQVYLRIIMNRTALSTANSHYIFMCNL